MQDIISIIPEIITGLFTAIVAWFFARKKNLADTKSTEIDNEIKAAAFYKSLLDDAKLRLDQAIQAIEERDKRLAERDLIIQERDKRIDLLLDDMEILTTELKKYKQLNGKQE